MTPSRSSGNKRERLLLDSLDVRKKSTDPRGRGVNGDSNDGKSCSGGGGAEGERIPAARPPFSSAARPPFSSAARPPTPSISSFSSPPPPRPPASSTIRRPHFIVAPMQESDIPEVLRAIASTFSAEARGLGLSEEAFVDYQTRLLATGEGRRAFGLAGVAREEERRGDAENGGTSSSSSSRGEEGTEQQQQPGAFLGIVVVQGAGEEEGAAASASSSSLSPAPPSPLLSRLRSLREGFGSVRSLCGARVAALHLARDLLLPEALAGGELLLEYLAVVPGARGRGVGRALLEHAVAGAKARESKTALTLWVDEGNEAALALYASEGFRRAGKEREEEREVSLSSSFAAAAMKLYHRALCRFFLGSSRWIRLALPLGAR